MPAEPIYLGVDFSGSAAMWGPRVTRSNVWIAEATPADRGLRVLRLRRVQELDRAEGERPFDALARLVASDRHAGAGIDAPFSLPERYWPPSLDSHDALLRATAARPVKGDFARGADFRAWVLDGRPCDEAKPLRATERSWRERGLNVRSTLWAGPRGGAAFTSACLTLLGASRDRVWPWRKCDRPVAEAFPAAQLKQWGLPHTKYDGEEGGANRAAIVNELLAMGLLVVEDEVLRRLRDSADALDAALCAFASLAIAENRLAECLPEEQSVWRREGWIAVHA